MCVCKQTLRRVLHLLSVVCEDITLCEGMDVGDGTDLTLKWRQ